MNTESKGKKVTTKGVSSRENKLFIINILQFFLIIILIIIIAGGWYLQTLSPSAISVIDDKGVLLGDYKTTLYRDNETIKSATTRFISCDLSFNSQTIYEDLACALNMMGEDARAKRLEYIKAFNIAKRISNLSITSKIVSIDTKINRRIGNNIEVSTQGKIQIGAAVIRRFRMDITYEQIQVSESNTTGLKVIASKEYELRDMSQFLSSYGDDNE